MPELLFAVSVSQPFMDTIIDRVVASTNRRHPELVIAETPHGGHGAIHIGPEKVSAAMMSVMNGYRTDIPVIVATGMYVAVITDNPGLVNDDTIAQLSEIAVFGSVLKPTKV